MKDVEQIYCELTGINDYVELGIDKAIQALGILIDISCDLLRSEGFNHALKQSERLLSQDLSETQRSTIHYFVGNAWSGLRALKHSGQEKIWDWEQIEIENEILNFRLCNQCSIRSEQDSVRFCQTNTNLGNTLSHVGRFVDAILYWDMALRQNPTFGMALANKGFGLVSYARSLYDNGHVGVFLKFAYSLLKRGLQTDDIHTGGRTTFEQTAKDVEARVGKEFLNEPLDMTNYSLGDSEAEQRYRRWCMDNHLFLNPLNDLSSCNIAARDILSCPSLYTSIDESSASPPAYFGFYNQIKQEYVSARYLFYDSAESSEPHYSDRDVLLYNTLDYPCYGLNSEKVKIAFRMVYSLFDKIAYFINEYLRLKIPDKKTSFKTLWYNKQQKSKGLRDEFADLKNWPFRGLFWLAKDLSENRREYRESMEPDARSLVDIRNYLEHKYLTITEYDMSGIGDKVDKTRSKVYSISRDDFALKTLRLMKLARAALIYLSLGVHIEERKRLSEVDEIIAPMPLDVWDDEWKT